MKDAIRNNDSNNDASSQADMVTHAYNPSFQSQPSGAGDRRARNSRTSSAMKRV